MRAKPGRTLTRSPGWPKWGTLWVSRICMYPSLERIGWFRRRSTPGWRTADRSRQALLTVEVLVEVVFAAFLAPDFALALGLALPGFLSVILAMMRDSLLAGRSADVPRPADPAGPRCRIDQSERDIVVVGLDVGRGCRRASGGRRGGGAGVVAAPGRAVVARGARAGARRGPSRGGRGRILVLARPAAAALVAAADELDAVGLDLELGPLLAGRLVVPLVELEEALDVDRPALLEILARRSRPGGPRRSRR